jgi:uncharacterized protein (DUF302 family)
MKPVEHRITQPFDETLEAVTKAISAAGMTVFGEIDHAKAARGSGLSMPETRVVIYGSPKAGTGVMLETPLAALDLPMRILVRELPGHRSAIAFHPMAASLEALGVTESAARKLQAVQQEIAEALEHLLACVDCGSRPTKD